MIKTSIYLLALSTFLFSGEYSANMAQNHVGEKATVCGNVVSSHYARSSKGRPTFLDLDASYPNQVFTAIIWGDDRRKFGRTEVKYSEKNICVTGKIKQ